MAEVTVRIDRAKLKEIGMTASHKATERAAQVTARRIRAYITTYDRVKTSAMRRSIKVRTVGPYTKEIYSTLEYTAWQNDGANPHVIVPRRPPPHGLLVFYWEKIDAVVKTRRVFHPGIKGAKFYEAALARLTIRDFAGRV